jgi:hypothetical protein
MASDTKVVAFLVFKGMNEASASGMDSKTALRVAKELGYATSPVYVETWDGKDKDGAPAGKPGSFLVVDMGAGFRGNGRIRISTGELTRENREKAIALLTRIGNGAADLAAELEA